MFIRCNVVLRWYSVNMPLSSVFIIWSRPSDRAMPVMITNNDIINNDNNNSTTIHRDSNTVLGFCWWEPRRVSSSSLLSSSSRRGPCVSSVFLSTLCSRHTPREESVGERTDARAASVKIWTRVTDKIDTHGEPSVSVFNLLIYLDAFLCVLLLLLWWLLPSSSLLLAVIVEPTCSAISCNVNNTMPLPFRIFKTMNYCVVVAADHGRFAYVSASRRNVSVEIWCDFTRFKLNDSEPSDASD